MTRPGAPVVIGGGNVPRGDDGAGPAGSEALHDRAALDPGTLPPGTRLVDGGTLGLDLARLVDPAAALVLVDAADRAAAPGTVIVRRDARTMRDGAVGELLAVAGMLGSLPADVTLIEIGAEELGVGIGLSPVVAAAVPVAAAAVIEALARIACPAGVSA